MFNFIESDIILVYIFLIAVINGVLYGLVSNIIARWKLRKFRENFFAKFKSSIIFGFLLIFFNKTFWVGYIIGVIFKIIIILVFYNNFEWIILLLLVIIWYLLYIFIYSISRGGFDLIFGSSPPKPYIKIKNPMIQNGYHEIFKWLENNLNAPCGKLKHRWAMPAGKFMFCYLWDSAFISQVWKYWDMEIASEILLPLLDNQTEDGRIPHFVGFSSKSEKIQPPLLAWAICNLDVNNDYLKIAYSKLKRFNNWLYKNRRLKNGLFFWLHSYESGIDNSPRFTDRSEKQKRDLTSIAAIDINTFVVLQNQSLIEMAEKLQNIEKHEDLESDINKFLQKKDELIKLIQNYLWDEAAGLYFDYDINKEKRIEINTIASFFPLITGIPTEQQFKRLIQHLESPNEYNTKIPLPTVALNDQYFEKDTWRGPVWINTAYLVIKGLEKYQKYKLSGDFAFRLIKGIFNTWENEGSFYEFYDPERFELKELSRKKGNLYKQITLGGKPVKNFIGWTGLVNSLLIESVIGYNKLKNTVQPCLPVEFKGEKIILGFPLDSKEIRIDYINEKNIKISVIDLSKKITNEFTCSLYQKTSLI